MSDVYAERAAAAFNSQWQYFEGQEFGEYASPDPSAELGVTDLFAIATDGQQLAFEPVLLDPDDPESAIVSMACDPEEQPADGGALRVESSIAVFEPVDISTVPADGMHGLHLQMDMVSGVRRGVRMVRLTSETQMTDIQGGEVSGEILTRDMVQELDLAHEPPRVLAEHARPAVVTVPGPDGTIADRHFADPGRPASLDTLRGMIEAQADYRRLLGTVCMARGIDIDI